MTDYVFRNGAILDTVAGALMSGVEVLVTGNRIARVEHGTIEHTGAEIVDLGGRTLMPGLIDCHTHIASFGMATQPTNYNSWIAARGSVWLKEMLLRGFTTLRDAGGADAGYRKAVEDGLWIGPRMFVSGRSISQTGGHSDRRWRADPSALGELILDYERIADGVDQCVRAVRDELRRGANQIKIMASGGVASQGDGIEHLQYNDAEMTAMVEEAGRQHSYVMAHVYSDEGIRRASNAGIRTLEHCNFLQDDTAKVMAANGTYMVPTLITYQVDGKYGASVGFSEESLVKNTEVLEAGTRSLDIARRNGVKMAYGTDLAFSPKKHQPEEFLVRSEVLTAAEIIRSATVIGAEVVQMSGKLGVVAEGAFADLLVIDGNPLEDLQLFQNEGAHMSAIMKDGVFHKNTLG